MRKEGDSPERYIETDQKLHTALHTAHGAVCARIYTAHELYGTGICDVERGI